MAIEVKSVSASAYLGPPLERLSGEKRATLSVFLELINTSSQVHKLKRTDFTFSLKDEAEQLIWVDQAHQLNGKWEIRLSPNTCTSLKLIVEIPDYIFQIRSNIKTYHLEILTYRILIEPINELPLPKD